MTNIQSVYGFENLTNSRVSITELTLSTKSGSPMFPGSLKGTSIYLGQFLKPETEISFLRLLSPDIQLLSLVENTSHESVKRVPLRSLLTAITLVGIIGSGLCCRSRHSDAPPPSSSASLQAKSPHGSQCAHPKISFVTCCLRPCDGFPWSLRKRYTRLSSLRSLWHSTCQPYCTFDSMLLGIFLNSKPLCVFSLP